MISIPADRLGEPGILSARDLLRRQFRVAHALLDAGLDACPDDALRRRPPPCAGGASAIVRYARAVFCEDMGVNGILANRAPLALSSWAGRTGLSELPPHAGVAEARAETGWTAWARRVRIERGRLRAYAGAVYASTDAYIAALPVDAFDPARRGTPPCVLTALLLNVAMRRGEMACLAAFNSP